MKILIAEDEAITLKTLENMLSSFGDVELATNGEEAYMMFVSALDKNQPFDLIFLDINMPEFDGHEALKAMRDYEDERCIEKDESVPIIIISSHSDGENIYNAHLEGCNNYILKPVSRDKIKKVLGQMNL